MNSDKYHYHYNELRPIRGIHAFSIFPWVEESIRVKAYPRYVSCHGEIEDVRKSYRGISVMTFDGLVDCPP